MELPPDLQEEAFRYQLIAPLTDPDATVEMKRSWRRHVLRKVHEHPKRGAVRVSARSLRRWLRAFRQNKMAGLKTAVRQKTGPKVLTEEALEYVETRIRENPRRNTISLLEDLAAETRFTDLAKEVSRSTLNRHLHARGVNRLVHPELVAQPPFKAFESPYSNYLWHSDVHYGPDALDDAGNIISTYIVSWLDGCSRVCCHCQAYDRQNFNALMDAFRKALLKFGICERSYCDNGGIYSGTQYALVCSDLGIIPRQTGVARPWQNGKQERIWGTQECEVFSELRLLPPLPLKRLNDYLQAWVEATYHTRPHSTTKQSPMERWHALKPALRYPTDQQIERLFWLWEKRCVSSTSIVQLFTNKYLVDPSLAGRWVIVRYDPNNLTCVHIWSLGKDRKLLCKATAQPLLVQRREKPAPPRDIQPSSTAVQRRLDAIETRYQKLLAQQAGFIQFATEEDS